MGLDHEHTRYYSLRPRRVPPEFCTDDLLEECSLLAALALYRIISQADDQGRLPGSPKHIRGLCFGMRPKVTVGQVAAALDELVQAGFVVRYEAAGRTLLQVDRWLDLQGKWGRHAYPSRYPAPPGWTQDWVDKSPPDASELRADDEQQASELHTPISIAPPFTPTVAFSSTVTPPFSPSVTPPGLSHPARRTRGWESPGDILRASAGGSGLPSRTSEGTEEAIPRRSVR